MKRIILGLIVVICLVTVAFAGDIGFIEDYALAKDRSTALKSLIPGTEDYYYYHCLNYLQLEQYDKAEDNTRPWLSRFGQTPRLLEIQLRHALLTYDKNPQRSLDFLKEKMNLQFNHQKEVHGAAPNLPTALDPKLIAKETLLAMSLKRWQNLDNFSDHALDWLAAENLNVERRRLLLQRLNLPDVPNLIRLIVEDLNAPNSAGFGAYPIHKQLTLDQMSELTKLKPELFNQTNFVNAWLVKLHPSADEDWRHDLKLMQAYLDRLWTFVSRLNPSHHSLQAHVLYHRLVLDRMLGIYDQARFIEYLKLPRLQGYVSQRWLERPESKPYPVDLNANFEAVTLLPIIGSDEPLVRSYLKQLLVQVATPREFEPYINDVYLKHVFAETKIENGLGEPEQWAASLTPELFSQLKERVDIDFAYTNAQSFKSNEPVTLDLFIKNVPTLMVKIFEINTGSYYREHKKEIDTDINLDGLVPNEELTIKFTDSPFRRVPRRIELPRLKASGVYVVDFIGAGKSSRALIRKGRLHPLVATGSMGQIVTVFDEANHKVMGTKLWLNGQEFEADKDGQIVIPFSTQPGRQPIILNKGDFASLDAIDHAAEAYQLKAGIHVERESLLAQRVAKVLIRPSLLLNGQPISIRRLEEIKLRITSTDHDGIVSTQEVPDFKLFEDRESEHEFRVPARLSQIKFELHAKVKNQSQSKQMDVADSQGFGLNGIDKTDRIHDLHLTKDGANYVLEVRGRTGELKADMPVSLSLGHCDFKEPIKVTLKTNLKGQVHLGSLPEIKWLTATLPNEQSQPWDLVKDEHSYRAQIHAKLGDAITLPYLGQVMKPSRTELALFRTLDGIIVSDHFAALSIKNGLIEIVGLSAGDYDLWLKDHNEHIQIRIVNGTVTGGFVLGTARQLELPGLKPVQIESIIPQANDITIKLRDPSPYARVHIFVTRYKPQYSAFTDLGRIAANELSAFNFGHTPSNYLTARIIDEEYRYVLERRLEKKYPGNMLERPHLLLNPWARGSTETTEQEAKSGDNAPSMEKIDFGSGDGAGSGIASGRRAASFTSNLDFLADAALVAANLIPDKDGLIELSTKDWKTHGWVHVVAVDPLSTTYRSISLPEQSARILDLRLAKGLDPASHFTQQKLVNLLTAGQPFVVSDITRSRFEAYDSLGKVYTLYSTLNNDPKLAEFRFILNWPTLKADEKHKLYSKYACHELSFFLKKKDPEFFAGVIKHYLANKKDKTFLDHWLLETDLTFYQEPWHYARLNVMERILLAQRLNGEVSITTRQLNDQWKVLPPNLDRTRMLFETAIKSGALDTEGRLGEQPKVMMFNGQHKGSLNVGAAIGGDDKPRSSSGGSADIQEQIEELIKRLPEGERRELAQTKDMSKDESIVRALPANKKTADLEAMKQAMTRRGFTDKKGNIEGKPDDEKFYYASPNFFAVPARQLYRKVDPTQELAENNYYNLLIQQQLADLVTVNPFWLDYARHDGKSPFFTKHLPEASTNFTEMMFALAVLDLPFTPGKHEIKFEGPKMTFTPATTAIAFHEEVRPAAAAPIKIPILVSQNFYRPGDRYREVSGEKIDHFVTGEFLVQTIYGCQIVITNPTSSRQKLTALLQLPVGAMPLKNGQQTKSVPVDLEPYHTQTIDYLFYFPLPGKFAHFPVNVAKNEQFLISTPAVTFDVVEKLSNPDTQSWDYVSQNGTTEEVLALLNRENVNALNLDKIAFRMKDKGVFDNVLALLRSRHLYQPTLWSYSLYHNSEPAMREYLRHADQLIAQCGNGPLISTPLVIEPVERYLYEHLEYKPLVNARTHTLGQRRQIVNNRLNEQFHRFLKMLSYKKQLDDADLLAVTYYLLLQDRIDEAVESFSKINAAKLATKMQYDYCAAYLAMFAEDTARARTIATQYVNHPVDRWKIIFAAMLNQLDEIEGKAVKVADDQNRDQQQGQLASTEPTFDFKIDSKAIQLNWQNLETVRINYYLMDVELLFSRNPFMQEYGGQFAAIKPNRSQEVKLPPGQRKDVLQFPNDLLNKNVLIEIEAAGKVRQHHYFANAMTVTMQENYGQLKVAETAGGKLLPKVYVKVYAQNANGQVKFYKDGYTDHRGKFDYASVSTPEKNPIERFAILVLSDDQGALIREVAPPAQ